MHADAQSDLSSAPKIRVEGVLLAFISLKIGQSAHQ